MVIRLLHFLMRPTAGLDRIPMLGGDPLIFPIPVLTLRSGLDPVPVARSLNALCAWQALGGDRDFLFTLPLTLSSNSSLGTPVQITLCLIKLFTY